MTTIVAVLVLVTITNASGFVDPGPHCSGTNMKPFYRRDFLSGHNSKRVSLAYGKFRKSFSTANNMSFLVYDCDLEKSADDTAKSCEKEHHYDFNSVGSNIATFYSDQFDVNFIFDAVTKWWDTARTYSALVNLTPSVNDTSIIPFLQMGNAATTRLGCAFHKCESTDSSSFYSLVCKYGQPHIQVGTPFYTAGPPCSTCPDRCIWLSLCNNTAV